MPWEIATSAGVTTSARQPTPEREADVSGSVRAAPRRPVARPCRDRHRAEAEDEEAGGGHLPVPVETACSTQVSAAAKSAA